MTDHEIAEKLLSYLDSRDNEMVHGKADDALLEALTSAGYVETVAAYNRLLEEVGFWYA